MTESGSVSPMSNPAGAGEPDGPAAAVVTIGDELLRGDVVNGNGAWLGRRLTELGFRMVGIHAVEDEEERIGTALGRTMQEADLVIATGGLGPTLDDRTREAVAGRWNLDLTEDPELLERMRARFRDRGYHDLPATNRRVALVPRGARVLENPRGSSPALHLTLPRAGSGSGETAELILLPGVPREMRALMDGPAGEVIRDAFSLRLEPARARTLHTTGIAESVLAGRIEAVLAQEKGVDVAYRPSLHGVQLRLLARGPEAEEALDRAIELLDPILAEYRYDSPAGDLAEALGRALQARGLRIALAESCTGGLVLKRLTDIPGSSNWTVGGVVAYADRIKESWLQVPGGVLEAHGAVSEGSARAMAEGVQRRMGVEVGVAVTGIAGPGGAVPGKPVGTVWFAVAGPEGTSASRVRFSGDREEIRERAAQHALHLALRYLAGSYGKSPIAEVGPEAGSGEASTANPPSSGG